MKPILAKAVLASAALFASFLNVPNAAAVQSPAAIPVMAQLLFVQNAHGVAISADGKTLTLKGLSPTTLFFSDRPVRIAGHYRTERVPGVLEGRPRQLPQGPTERHAVGLPGRQGRIVRRGR